MQKAMLFFIPLFLLYGSTKAQNTDPKKGVIKIRKPYQQEFFIKIDSMLTYNKGDITQITSEQINYSQDIIDELNGKEVIRRCKKLLQNEGILCESEFSHV